MSKLTIEVTCYFLLPMRPKASPVGIRPRVGWVETWTVFPRSTSVARWSGAECRDFSPKSGIKSGFPDFDALLPGYEGFFGFCGWMVSPAASIVTNFSILAARVSGFLALCTR